MIEPCVPSITRVDRQLPEYRLCNQGLMPAPPTGLWDATLNSPLTDNGLYITRHIIRCRFLTCVLEGIINIVYMVKFFSQNQRSVNKTSLP